MLLFCLLLNDFSKGIYVYTNKRYLYKVQGWAIFRYDYIIWGQIHDVCSTLHTEL